MIVEMFVYQPMPGRMQDLVNRFEKTTTLLFEKHGFKLHAFFTTLIGPSMHELTYMLVWESYAKREACWETFRADPEWIAARAETEKDGPIVASVRNQILAPTSFSPLR